MTTLNVLREVEAERVQQDRKWGQQDHPDVRPRVGLDTRYGYGIHANHWKAENDLRARDKSLAWDGILLEEVYEALAEEDPDQLRAELVQVAAVATAWVECIDRRAKAEMT